MTLRTYVKTDVSQDGSTFSVIWSGIQQGDTCQGIRLPEYADKSFQAIGTFGASTPLAGLTGTNMLDDTSPQPLHDPGGTAISLSAAGIRQVLENVLTYIPTWSGGDGTTAVSIVMLFRLNNPKRT